MATYATSTRSSVSVGRTVELNGLSYYVPATPVTTLDSHGCYDDENPDDNLIPLTIVGPSSSGKVPNISDPVEVIQYYNAVDDVFQEDFLGTIYVQCTSDVTSAAAIWSTSGSWNAANLTKTVSTAQIDGQGAIPPGPYFMSTAGTIYEAWRLYSDYAGAFTEPVIGNPDGTFRTLPAGMAGQSLAVAVPSRLYSTRTLQKPLAGVRIGIKDIYDVAGVKTGNGNRAWYHLYGPAERHSTPVQRLVDAGAVIVGKMKTSQFANGEEPTGDWVDYHAPFNPRGDGAQGPSSSSAGAGAGSASYEWLDVSLGSDTGGSIRGPSQVQGLYGNRPSHDLVGLEGVMPLAPELDTAGFLARDPAVWSDAAKVLYGKNITLTRTYPKDVLTVDLPSTASSDADGLVLELVRNLTSYLDAQSKEVDFDMIWNSTKPMNITQDLDSYLNLTYPIIISQQQTHLVRDGFYADYAAVHDGRRPFIDPAPLIRWAFGDSLASTQYDIENAKRAVFAKWFSSHILAPDETTCSQSLLVYAASSPKVNYRNEYLDEPEIPYGFSTSRLSPFWGGPDFVLPLGSAKYFSNVTIHEEYLPVTVNIMAARGCDGMLFGLVLDLVEAGILKPSMVGYRSDGGGDVLCKRDD